MNEDIKRIAKRVEFATGLDPFKETRKQEYVEARAMLVYVYRTVLKLRLSDITRVFNDNGKKMHHSTLIHSLKNWDLYLKYSPRLQRQIVEILSQENDSDTVLKTEFINMKIKDMPKEIVEEVYDIMYNEYIN